MSLIQYRKGLDLGQCESVLPGVDAVSSPCRSSDRVLRCRLAKIGAERCESGRIDMLGKHASQQWDRGFESHPLRHKKALRDESGKLGRDEKWRGWDSNRGIVGDVSPAWGAYEGAGPLCRSERCFSARDFECPPSPPHQGEVKVRS